MIHKIAKNSRTKLEPGSKLLAQRVRRRYAYQEPWGKHVLRYRQGSQRGGEMLERKEETREDVISKASRRRASLGRDVEFVAQGT